MPKIVAHAMAGGLASELQGADFTNGALAAALSEISGPILGQSGLSTATKIELQKLVGGAAVLLKGGSPEDAATTGAIAQSAYQNNYLNHAEAVERARSQVRLSECQASPGSCSDKELQALQGTVRLLDALDQSRDMEYLSACAQQGTMQCLAARHRYIEAQATFMDANRKLGDAGYVKAFGNVFEQVQAEFKSGLATDRAAMEAGLERGVRFSEQNMKALGLGAGAGAATAVAYFGGASLTRCFASPICRAEASVAIAEAAAGDALGGATLMPVVVGGKVALTYGDNVVGFIDETTGAFVKRADMPYDPRAVRQALEETYGADKILSTTVPPLNKPNVRLAGKSITTSDKVIITFDSRGFPVFDDVALFDTRFASTKYRDLSNDAQMKLATEDLRAKIAANRQLEARFEPDQLKAINAGNSRIPGLVWHHHQDGGRMQLVTAETHREVRHIGGNAMWEGR